MPSLHYCEPVKRRRVMSTLNRRSTLAIGCAAVAALVAYPLSSLAAEKDRHPRIRGALEALLAARDELRAADNDFGGHKKDALDAIDAAIHQLQLALDFAEKKK